MFVHMAVNRKALAYFMKLIIYQLPLRDSGSEARYSNYFGVNEGTGFTKPLSI